MMAKSPSGKSNKKKNAKKKARVAPTPVKKATASKSSAKRYRATPSGTSDRQHLLALIQETTGCSARAAKETFNGIIGSITASLKKNKKVQFLGFGSFVVTKRPAHKGRNPQTGESIQIKASKAVRFRAGQTLKRSV